MSTAYPLEHTAIVTPGVRQPLTTMRVPTVAPGPGEVVVRTHLTASTPLDLHQADGGLLISHPGILGSSNTGEIVAIHPEQPPHINLSVGDKVFGFSFAAPKEKAHQTYITVQSSLVGRIPDGVSEEEAVTVPTNLVTAVHSLTTDLELSLPWPKPEGWEPEGAKEGIVLVWGAGSSVGMFTLQVLRYWGYHNVLAVASQKHHEQLRELGARGCVDYKEDDVVGKIKDTATSWGYSGVTHVLDCIGSLNGSLVAISKIAERGSKVAIMLPVIVRDAGHEEGPLYEMDVKECLKGEWKDGVELRGVRTHFYQKNEFFRDHLQPEIVPKLLEMGVVKANKIRIVEGATMLERAETALEIMRHGQVSGEKLVWALDQE